MGRQIKEFFLNCLSFGSPSSRVFNFFSIFFVLRFAPLNYFNPFKCVFKNYLFPLIFRGNCPVGGLFAGCNCPACGLTRAMASLLRGDFVSAFDYNKMVFVVFFFIVGFIFRDLYLIYKSR